MKKLTVLIALTGFTAVLCANTQAAETSAAPSLTVRYSTSDAVNDASVARLYRRIDAAAGQVCGERMAPGSPFVSRSWRSCVQSAMRAALVQINNPAVATYAAARGMVVVGAATASRN